MKHLCRSLIEHASPLRGGSPANRSRRMGLLQAVMAVAIVLAWGPEIFAAMEMTALLEVLGASLFITAYGAGLKLKAIEISRALQSTVFPLGQLVVIRSNARAGVKVVAAVSAFVNAIWLLASVMVAGAFGHHLLALAT